MDCSFRNRDNFNKLEISKKLNSTVTVFVRIKSLQDSDSILTAIYCKYNI